METHLYMWVGFIGVVITLLALDLFVFHRKAHEVSMRESAAWTAFWVGLSVAFGLLVWQIKGGKSAVEFFTGYAVEYSLSMDNVFVIALIFTKFGVPRMYQHRVLFWGILGAVVMRGIMIGAGAQAVARWEAILYVFGALLLYTGIKLLVTKDEGEGDIENSRVVQFCRRHFPVTGELHGQKFIVQQAGRWCLTPLALVLVLVETTDLIFAVDSIPAIFAVTQDPFIVFTSNICAILGLRSLFFLLSGVIHKFVYLKTGLAVVLTFIGVKMLIAKWIHIEAHWSLLVIIVILGGSIALSLLRAPKEPGNDS